MTDKYSHVRSQLRSNPGDHECHWPGCGRKVPAAVWGCKPHWYKLPKRLQNKIWNAYRPGQEITKNPSRAYVEVAREVQDWIARPWVHNLEYDL